jgi:CHAT domain-containing protein/tetratricopeptide (TPR) repeat protein
MSRPHRWILLTLLLGSALAAGLLFLRAQFSSPQTLLDEAYFERRTLELRIGRARHSALRVERRQERPSRMDLPQILLEAEAEIARGLQRDPEDSKLLAVRGQASLLEGSYEGAITDLQEALDTQPKSAAVLSVLAVAYFERAATEDRFEDYGTAFELQSRALQQSPGDPVIVFNRAITAARLYLFKQSIQDWQRYLALDPAGDWSGEARRHLNEVQAIVEAHDKRTRAPLLTPAEFGRKIIPTDPHGWDAVEPRIEEYLSSAITEWLPAAFPADAKAAPSTDARRALAALAAILKTDHSDAWLEDLLSTTASPSFGAAVDALRRAVKADNADYTLGRNEAARAAGLFARAGNRAGELRARYEEAYSLGLSDAGQQCLAGLGEIAQPIEDSQYGRLRIQLNIERYNCSSEDGDLRRTDHLAAAYGLAKLIRYPALELRLLSIVADDDQVKGRRRSGSARYGQGFGEYWSSSVNSYLGRALYAEAGFVWESSEYWNLARASDEQDLAIATAGEDPLSLAVENSDMALASLMALDPERALKSIEVARGLLNSVPQTETTENYRLTVESHAALVDAEMGHVDDGLARLERVRPQVAKDRNVKVAAEFYRIAGELQCLAGRPELAEHEFRVAVALGEKMRRLLRSESDQISWMREWSRTYVELVETEFRLGRPSDALDVWQLHRDVRPPAASANTTFSDPGSDSEIAVASMRLALSRESESTRLAFSQHTGQTVLILGLTPHGLAIWTYDDRGMTAKWIERDPAHLRLESERLAELCEQPSSSLEGIHALAQRLYDALIAPVSDRLRPNQALVIQTDDTLSVVPFQVLLDGTGKYLEDSHPISYLPALNGQGKWREAKSLINSGSTALVVASAGGSGDGLKPLSDAMAEARAVLSRFPGGHLLTGNQASSIAVSGQLPQAEVFHFAGHAFGGSGRSGLILDSIDDRVSSELFGAASFRKVPLPKLQLAVLSACSTENGGEGLPGDFDSLARALLAQGVPHVVASRWNVDSASSASLMDSFYANLLTGVSATRALAAAEAALRKRAPHPYYWAAFDAFGQN